MPTVADLQRLDALVQRLGPLRARRGEPVEAAAWNAVVEGLVELARAVLARAEADHAPPHEHLGEVGPGWLTPPLRALLERGPLADPVSEERLREGERRARRTDAEIGDLRDTLDGLRGRVDGVVTRDLEREARLVEVDRRAQGVPQTREEILGLRRQLDTIRGDLRESLDRSAALQVNGEPVDLGGLLRRVEAAEEVRERLTTADGDLLDATAIEVRVAELQNEFVSRDELDEIVRDRPVLDDRPFDDLRDALRESLAPDLERAQQEALGRAVRDVEGRFDARLDRRLADVDARVAEAAAALEGDLRSAVVEAVRPDLDARLGALGERLDRQDRTIAETVAGRVEEATAAFRTELAGRLDGLRESVGALDARLGGLRETVGAVEAGLGGLRQQVGGVEAEVARVGARADGVGARLGAVEGGLRELSGSVQSVRANIDEALQSVERVSADLSRFDTRLDEVERGRIDVDPNRPVDPVIRDPIVRDPVVRDPVGPGRFDRLGGEFRVLPGVGEARRRRLVEGGITDLRALAAADPDRVASLLSVSRGQAEAIVSEARGRIR